MVDSEAYYRRVLAAGYENVPNPIRIQALLAEAKQLDLEQRINSFAHTVDGSIIFPCVQIEGSQVSVGTVDGVSLSFSVAELTALVEQYLSDPGIFNPIDTRLLLERGATRYDETLEKYPLTREQILAIHIISMRMKYLAMCTYNPDIIAVLHAEDVMSYDEVASVLAILPTAVYPTLRNS